MKTVLKTITTAIALTAITAGSAFACDKLDDQGQALNFDYDLQSEVTITSFGCDEVDTVAEDLKSRLDVNDSFFSKIVKTVSRS